MWGSAVHDKRLLSSVQPQYYHICVDVSLDNEDLLESEEPNASGLLAEVLFLICIILTCVLVMGSVKVLPLREVHFMRPGPDATHLLVPIPKIEMLQDSTATSARIADLAPRARDLVPHEYSAVPTAKVPTSAALVLDKEPEGLLLDSEPNKHLRASPPPTQSARGHVILEPKSYRKGTAATGSEKKVVTVTKLSTWAHEVLKRYGNQANLEIRTVGGAIQKATFQLCEPDCMRAATTWVPGAAETGDLQYQGHRPKGPVVVHTNGNGVVWKLTFPFDQGEHPDFKLYGMQVSRATLQLMEVATAGKNAAAAANASQRSVDLSQSHSVPKDESHQRQQATSKLKRWLWMSPEVELKKYTDKDGRSGTTYLMKNANVERVRGPRALVHGAISAVTPGMKTELLGAAAASTATGSALASEIVGVGTLGVQYATDTAQDSLMATAGSKGLTDLLGKVDSTTVDAAYSAASQVATAAVGAKAAGVVAATTQLPAATTVVAGTILAFGAGSMKCDLVAGILAVIISSAVMYPIDTMKTRVQVGKARVPKAGPLALFKGIWLSILKKAPEASVYIVLNRFARNKFVHDGFTVGNRIIEPELFFDWMVAAAIGAAVACSVIKVPLELLSKQIQSGQCSNLGSAFRKVFLSPSSGITFFYSWLAVLIRDIPRGALQYAIIHTLERLPWLEALGIPLFFQRLIWAAVAAGFVAIVTTPFDVISSKIMTGMQEQMRRGRSFLEARVGSEFRFRLRKPRGLTVAIDVIREVYRQKGLRGFWSGCVLRAAYYVPGTCIQYATFETLAALLGNWL